MIIGIDLGTSTICCSYYKNNKINFINPNNPLIPALVYVENNITLVGFDAILYKYSDNCYHSLKRLLNNKKLYILLLKYIKNICDQHIDIYDVIITTPVYFNEFQRNFTKECIIEAGFNCIRMINEPTSACIAYGLNHSNNTILVLDIGGGTTDISIVRNEDDMIEVLISHGNPYLGGNDITNKLIDYIIKKYKLLNNIDNNLFHIFDKIKIKLSNCEKYTEQINIDDTNIVLDITSNEFINACDDIWKSIEYLIMESLEKSKLTQDNIDYIILVGGSSKIPHIKNIIKKIFHYNKLLDTMNPETIVSEGASILGAIINNTLNKDLVLLDISQFEYSIEDDDNNLIVMIERNMLLPCKITKKFTTTKDYINDIEIKIFQDNLLLGKLELNKLEYEKKGIPVINITFELDVSAMLIVYIEDKKTGSKIMNKFY